jgi:hypothetical protein
MSSLALADLPEAIPIQNRSAEAPDGLDLNGLLIPNPLSTFYMRVRGHRLRSWGVHDGDLLLIDRAIEPRPGHLVVVAYGGRFLLRPLEVEQGSWKLGAMESQEAQIPLDPGDLMESGVFRWEFRWCTNCRRGGGTEGRHPDRTLGPGVAIAACLKLYQDREVRTHSFWLLPRARDFLGHCALWFLVSPWRPS